MLIENSNNEKRRNKVDKNSIILSSIFDDLNNEFVARLREISSNTRTTSDGKATITFKTARIEANYTPEIIKKIEPGRLIAIPNVMGIDSDDSYSCTRLQMFIQCIIVC